MKCCDCKVEKTEDLFYKGQKRCKDCTKLRNKIFKQKNPDYYKKGNMGYGYDKITDKKTHNKDRYAKHQHKYIKYNKLSRETPRGALYGILEAIRDRAYKAGYEPDFDLDYLQDLFNTQEGCCAATGIRFNLSHTSRIKRYRPFSVSIDRIDSNGKYEKSNVRLVCVAFNLALNAFGEEVFKELASSYINKNSLKS